MFSRDENKLEVVVGSEELKGLFLKAAKEHRAKAEFYRQTAEKVNIQGVEEDTPSYEELVSNYAGTVASKVDSAKKGLLDQAREHDRRATEKEFIANHLPLGQITLMAGELTVWGLL